MPFDAVDSSSFPHTHSGLRLAQTPEADFATRTRCRSAASPLLPLMASAAFWSGDDGYADKTDLQPKRPDARSDPKRTQLDRVLERVPEQR